MQESLKGQEKDGQTTTYVVMPVLFDNKPAVVFADGSYCREWLPLPEP